MKIAINRCAGGFALSEEAYRELGSHHSRQEERTDPQLIAVIERLGKAASGSCADLGIVEIPDGVEWEIHEHDGLEHVAEKHRTWF